MPEKNDPYEYLAKYVAKQGGDLHFGGTLKNVNFSDFRKSLGRIGRNEIVRSPAMEWRLFHLNNPKRKR